MLTKTTRIIAITLAALTTGAASAQSFDLSWHTIDGGGATFTTGGAFSLGGTIGQTDAGTMLGGPYALSGGFWVAAGDTRHCNDCTGDIDADGAVTLSDLTLLLAHFGTANGASCGDGDIQPAVADGDVDLADLTLLLANFGVTCP